jgi:HEAT repeat protein
MIALANFPTESAAALLRGAAADPAENPLVRRKALGGLARGWQAAALPALTTALADDDTLLRVAAVRALAALPGGEGAAALRARLLVETDPTVLAELRKGVSP